MNYIQFEYLIATWIPGAMPRKTKIEFLNEYGQKGWELCSIFGTKHYFKREILESDELEEAN